MPEHVICVISIIMYWHHIIGDSFKKLFLCFYFVFSSNSKKLFFDVYCHGELKQVKLVIKDVCNVCSAVYHHCAIWFSCLSLLHALLGTHFKMMGALRIWYMIHNTFLWPKWNFSNRRKVWLMILRNSICFYF